LPFARLDALQFGRGMMPGSVNANTAQARVAITRDDQDAIARLTVALGHRNGAVRMHARQLLVAIGSPAVDALAELIADRNNLVRWEAAKTLGEIADARAAPALVRALEDSDADVRWLAAEGLVSMGRDGLPALLHALVQHPHALWLRSGARHVLRGLRDRGLGDLVGPILEAQEGVEPGLQVVRAAIKVLDRMQGGSKSATG
ncbi:MAG: HEAT repeat domain-containing protein, partial [Anaerolineae bacterium]|nr:HEAT repeat domain-containing protein [Anaerolineae bacterium]